MGRHHYMHAPVKDPLISLHILEMRKEGAKLEWNEPGIGSRAEYKVLMLLSDFCKAHSNYVLFYANTGRYQIPMSGKSTVESLVASHPFLESRKPYDAYLLAPTTDNKTTVLEDPLSSPNEIIFFDMKGASASSKRAEKVTKTSSDFIERVSKTGNKDFYVVVVTNLSSTPSYSFKLSEDSEKTVFHWGMPNLLTFPPFGCLHLTIIAAFNCC